MGLFFDTNHLPAFRNPVLTIGTFDGVHSGHRKILQEVVSHAQQVDGESILITFEPHPRKVLFPQQPLKLLTSLKTKLKLIAEAGIQHIVIAPFTKPFSQLSAQEYIADFLVKQFRPHSIVIGYDHHFGHDRTGNIDLLKKYATEYNYKVFEIPAQLIDEAAISSTKIRNAINSGHVTQAAHMLGRNYSIEGTVIHGKKLGKTIGYPTANILPVNDDQLIPARGIYAVQVRWQQQQYNGMMSIGYNPTVSNEQQLNLEVNIFNFDQDIYGQMIEISFVAHMRDEEKFASLDELVAQLHKDKENALQILEA